MKHGDFTTLAKDYARWRPGYAPFILETFIALLGGSNKTVADIGAGTGIWSRMLASQGLKVISVEPNDAMRGEGIKLSSNYSIEWLKGSAEETGLSAHSVDAVCMASAFHWADFNKAIPEFFRILKPAGLFMALWNPRFLQSNPLLQEIEAKLNEFVPNMKRVSTGNSDFCNALFDRLLTREEIEGVLYLEGRHKEQQSQERYIGLWESVNDVKVQAGEQIFSQFMDYVRDRIKNESYIEAEYKTRAWIAKARS